VRVRITASAFSPEQELGAFAIAGAGACVSFVGLARGTSSAGAVAALELQHYPGFTEAEIERFGRKIVDALDLLDLLVVHRVGQIAPGEAIVLAAALSAHRKDAFLAVERLMDYLKTDAPFWKRELRADGAHWIEPTEEDRVRRARHDEETT
jgi:molybdopterin synthase catalytic subunit